ncbi:hypothetical protein SND48_17620 [Escherichia coli]|nr:hypothetical protein [Escherichia coli]
MIDWKHYFRYEKGKIYWINKNKFAHSIEIGDEAGKLTTLDIVTFTLTEGVIKGIE